MAGTTIDPPFIEMSEGVARVFLECMAQIGR
jgi:hypothetical protein